MNKTLLAVAVALAYSVTPAWADHHAGWRNLILRWRLM